MRSFKRHIFSKRNNPLEISALSEVIEDGLSRSYSKGVYFEGKVYLTPSDSNNILAIDTADDSISYIPTGKTGTYKYANAGEYNGKIYFFPRSQNNILILDPTNNSLSQKAVTGSDHRYGDWFITPEGVAYSTPNRTAARIVKYDINADTLTYLNSLIPEVNSAYHSGIMIGRTIYYIPFSSRYISIFDIDTETVVKLDTGLTETTKWQRPTLYTDGYLYVFPYQNVSSILKINPENNTFELIPNDGIGIISDTLAVRNMLVAITAGGSNTRISYRNMYTGYSESVDISNLAQRKAGIGPGFFWMFGGATRAPEDIYISPWGINRILKIKV